MEERGRLQLLCKRACLPSTLQIGLVNGSDFCVVNTTVNAVNKDRHNKDRHNVAAHCTCIWPGKS